ncbi:putative alpha/beta superfamily hydrolase [Variovorax sp. OAS795]|uniref:alpha/beta hydrolase n=1 Tax=Variovorax sp. OAS795 TaxID=3034231 RepID=UPI00339A8F1C
MQVGSRLRAWVYAGGWALLLAVSGCGGGGGGGGGGGALPIVAVAPTTPPADPPSAPPPAPPAPDAPATPPPSPPPPTEPAPPSEPQPAPASRVVTETITSAKTGATYSLEIYLPASYDGNSRNYPVIYAMDGDAVFNPPGTRFSNFRDILEQRGTQAILVGIGGTARREEDYALPGARAYHEFLTVELVPFIETRYRADVKKRVLTGLSLSGSMAGISLFLEGASGTLTFSAYLSFESAFDYQESEYQSLEQQMHDALGGKPLPATLILTHCGNPDECNSRPVEAMYNRLRARGYEGLSLTEATYETTHTQADIPSFTEAIASLLP